MVPIADPADHNVIIKITDVFGNTVVANADVVMSLTGAGLTVDGGTAATTLSGLTYSATEGGHGIEVWTTAAGSFALSLSITASDVVGLPTANKSLFLTQTAVSVAGLAAQISTLTAQVEALQAQMADMRTKARSVTKKKYNTLARKWNAATPGARVALQQ